MSRNTTYVVQPFDPADEKRHGLPFTTSNAEGLLVMCAATYENGDPCKSPVLVDYEHVPAVWAGDLKLCPYHQEIENQMVQGRAA